MFSDFFFVYNLFFFSSLYRLHLRTDSLLRHHHTLVSCTECRLFACDSWGELAKRMAEPKSSASRFSLKEKIKISPLFNTSWTAFDVPGCTSWTRTSSTHKCRPVKLGPSWLSCQYKYENEASVNTRESTASVDSPRGVLIWTVDTPPNRYFR